jgi:hypothetical protein
VKIYKNILFIAVLCMVNSIQSRTRGAASQPVPQKPAQEYVPRIPTKQPAPLVPKVPSAPSKEPIMQLPANVLDFYDQQTDMPRQDYLESFILDILNSDEAKEEITKFVNEKIQPIMAQLWQNQPFATVLQKRTTLYGQLEKEVDRVIRKITGR